jgi:hypothetical protein
MARLNGHRQTKGTETDKPIPTATAPHLDSTPAYFIFSLITLAHFQKKAAKKAHQPQFATSIKNR